MHYSYIIKKPIISEKSTTSAGAGCYIFEIDPKATKHQVREAVENLFDVKVDTVRTSKIGGKVHRGGKLRKRKVGSTKKKAYVTLKEGKIEGLFEE